MANWMHKAVKTGMSLSFFALCAPSSAFADDALLPVDNTLTRAEDVDTGWHPGVEVVSHVALGRTVRFANNGGDAELEMAPAGFLVTARQGKLRVGMTADLEWLVLAGAREHLGVVAGVVHDLNAPFRFEVLAEGGLSHYSALGAGLFTTKTSGDDSATLPYLGGRASFAWRFGSHRGGILGLFVGVQADLGQQTVHPDVTSCFFGCTTSRETVTVGGATFMTGLRVGFAP